MILISRDQVAELRGVTPSTVSRAHLPKTTDGRYDLADLQVWHYVTAPAVEDAIQKAKRSVSDSLGLEDAVRDHLEEEKLRKEIVWKEKQSRKLDREHEEKSRNLIYRNDVAIAFGAFIEGLKNNFLQLGTRIGRGDSALRDRVEKEVSKSIEKTVKGAQDKIRKIIDLELADE